MDFDQNILWNDALGMWLDLSAAPEGMPECMDAALAAMEALEGGAMANADEGRAVGHYWLRDPDRAPDPQIRNDIRSSWRALSEISPGDARRVLVVGIGGSALGPQLLADALSGPADPRSLHFLDNTDPEGIDRVLSSLNPEETLVLVVSKSGGTIETRNGMLACQQWFARAGLSFADSAIAITCEGSALFREAEHWKARLPLWDWVGGRTSLTGMVGLAPMALCGWDWRGLLRGAALADAWTRAPAAQNPAARLAAAWYIAGNARGDRALVVEPYRDRLALLGRYLQQLVMESIGKRLNRQGQVVHQGLTVYGNKGSTDQHAFIQQVRDGRDDCFVHFITTTEQGPRIPVDGATFADDHLLGFQLGTAQALSEAGRPHVTINTTRVDVQGLGALVAIFERAVGLYAELVGINAYHQPGVEAGKRGAKVAVERLLRLLTHLDDQPRSAEELASLAGGDAKTIWRLLEHLHATGRATKIAGERPSQDLYQRPS